MGQGGQSVRWQDEALRRARALWEDLIRLMIAKDRAWLRNVDTADLERLMEVRGVELAREEALIARLDGVAARSLDEVAHDWRAAPWSADQRRPGAS